MRIALITGVLGVAAACSSPPEPQAPEPPPPPPPQQASLVEPAPPPKPPQQATVAISDRIKEACGIADYDTLFDYDSAKLSGNARRVLQQLATCFATGPLKGHNMRLIGHADPRGDEEYNIALGGRRATNVKRSLVSYGLPGAQASSTSRGEMDATGTSESGWRRDRRVDVKLAD